MHLISAITCFAGLAATACARPLEERAALASNPPLQITNLTLYDEQVGNTTVTFNVYDPDPLANASARATCTGTWPHGTDDYPKDTYELCGNTTFAWNFAQWNGYQNFTLGVEHQFTDPAVGDPPYDQVTNFAKGAYNETVLYCEGVGAQIVCNQKKGTVVMAPIYATIA